MLASWNDGAAKSAIVDFVARRKWPTTAASPPEALDKPGEYGFTLVSMKRDRNAVFPA